MQYLSLDVETTSLDPKDGQLLQVAFIFDDLQNMQPEDSLPIFQAIVCHEHIYGDAVAIKMNIDLIELSNTVLRAGLDEPRWSNGVFFAKDWYLVAREFAKWVVELGIETPVNLAGKNLGSLDLPFLNEQFFFYHAGVKYRHRFIDPAILFFEPGDNQLPSLKTCLERAGIEKVVAHDALEDALDVMRLVRKGLDYV